MKIASPFVTGKIRNCRTVLQRATRDYPEYRSSLEKAIKQLESSMRNLNNLTLNELRGIEGFATSVYFEAFTTLLRTEDDFFDFQVRSRRPPRDPINACLSFAYSLLTQDYISALEGVGLAKNLMGY